MNTLRIIKLFVGTIFVANFNMANASLVTVRVENSGVENWEAIQKETPGFGSNGPVSLNWDPYDDLFTELLAYDRGYSGGGAAFCWYGENCALQLSVTAENTSISLQSFALGYYGYGNNVLYNVIDMASQTSILSDSPWVDGNALSLITVNASSNTGFMILFGPDGFNGGINDITYSYHSNTLPTPLPATAWLFGISLVGMIGFTRKIRFNELKTI